MHLDQSQKRILDINDDVDRAVQFDLMSSDEERELIKKESKRKNVSNVNRICREKDSEDPNATDRQSQRIILTDQEKKLKQLRLLKSSFALAKQVNVQYAPVSQQ